MSRETELERRLRQCVLSMEAFCLMCELHDGKVFADPVIRNAWVGKWRQILEWAREPMADDGKLDDFISWDAQHPTPSEEERRRR